MFTGLIQGTGKVISYKGTRKKGLLTLKPSFRMTQIKLGESIAIDGCCLTVTSKAGGNLSFDVSDETLRKTTLGSFKKGRVINLERALKASDRLGGHFVLGHVDGLATIQSIQKTKGFLKISFLTPKSLRNLIIDKGSVTIDGISLTASLNGKSSFVVHIIPETLFRTNLESKKKGDKVNLEVDVLGKYIAKLVQK